MKINDEIIVKIEKLTFGSLGLSRFGEEKFVVFVSKSLPDELIKVKIVSLNKHFAKGEIIEILEKSKNRIKPICPIYNACGSCDFQICDLDYSVFQKTSILKDIFNNVVDENKIYDVIKTSDLNYRHKVQFQARQTKNSKRILLGYFKPNSHDLTNVKFCPMQPEIVNEISKYIRENFPLDCFDEITHKGILKNVLFRISSFDESVLLNFVLNLKENELEKYLSKISKFSYKLKENFENIKSIYINLNPKKTNKILGEKDIKVLGEDFIIETLKDKKFKIGPTSFFQVNPKGASALFDVVLDNVKENSTILDAYGGVGAIGIYLKEKAKKITLVEENKNAIKMAKENFKLNNIENYEILEGDATKHLLNFKKENLKFDYVVLDPPRSGLEKEGLETLASLAKNIIYVSCNPQTLKRDIIFLKEKGFEAKFVQGVDMFPYTHHIESVAILEKA